MWVRAWQIAYRSLVPATVLDGLSVDEKREHWHARLSDGDVTFVAEQFGVAGYCRVVLPDEVASLYVLPERRRGGLGTALLTTALEELRAHSSSATSWVFADNHAARAFYTRFGFTPDGARQLDPGTGLDEIRLRVELARP